MKRKLMLVLIGTSMLVPIDAEAQRSRNRGREAARPAPVTLSGRLANCRAPARGQAFDCRSRVVYSSHERYGARRYDNRRFEGLWVRADWRRGRMSFGRGHGRHALLNRGDLRDILGRPTVQRLSDAGRYAGLRGRLAGHWEDTRGRGAILIVTMGGVELAEFIDFDRDGFVDDVFLARGHRSRRVASRW